MSSMKDSFIKEKFNLEDMEDVFIKVLVENIKFSARFINDIDVDYFEKAPNKVVFKLLKKYFKDYNALPSYEQMQMLAKKALAEKEEYLKGTLLQLKNIKEYRDYSETEEEFLTNTLREFIKRNKLRCAIFESYDLINDIEEFNTIDDKIRTAVLWEDEVKLGTRLEQVRERYDKIERDLTRIVPSPWPAYNKRTGGGFHTKQLAVFLSASSVGKSIVLDNVAFTAWAKGFNVVSISAELSEEIKGQRIDANILDITLSDLMRNKQLVFDKWDHLNKIRENLGMKNRIYIKEFPASKSTTKDIEQYLHKLKIYEGFKPDIIIIDYLDIIMPKMSRGSMYQDQGEVYENGRALAFDYDCPVVSAGQLNRSAYNKSVLEIDESVISESTKKMNTSDVMVAIGGTQEERANSITNWKMLKNRNGKKDEVFTIHINYEKFRFYQKDSQSAIEDKGRGYSDSDIGRKQITDEIDDGI
jgi:archaellum biogenesis ATPase FlaH